MMKLIKLIEAIHIQKPKAKEPEMKVGAQAGYLSRSETDPETGAHITYLEPEPSLIQMARAVDKSIKELKYFASLPSTEGNEEIKQEAMSIISSLRKAGGKLRDLQKKLEGIKRIK